MTISWLQYVIVCPLVFVAGIIDAIAGGGGLITLPAYMLAGLPVHNAIGTNKVSSTMGTAAVTARYAANGFIPWKQAAACVVFAIIGSTCGAKLALAVSDRYFKIIMLVIIPLTAVYILRPKSLNETLEPYPAGKTVLISIAAALIIGVYDGFYGPGTGTFLLLMLNGLAHMKLTEANGVTKVINLTTNASALAVYLINGVSVIPLGLAAGVFSVAGNLIGARYFEKGGAKSVKPVMILVLIIFMIKLISELITG